MSYLFLYSCFYSLQHLFIFLQLKELQYRVLDQELNKWKREQQLSGNGAPFTNNLDTIQKWYQNDISARFGDDKFVVESRIIPQVLQYFFNKRIISQILLIFKGISKDWLCLLSSEAIQIISSPTIFKLAANPDVLN